MSALPTGKRLLYIHKIMNYDLQFSGTPPAHSEPISWPVNAKIRPLLSYLKALGILRAATEIDEDAAGYWQDGKFHLHSRATADDLIEHLLSYHPFIPALCPWNGTSGFYKKSETLDNIMDCPSPRFNEVKVAIEQGRNLVASHNLKSQPKAKAKDNFVAACVAQITSDAWQDWAKTVLALKEDKKGNISPTWANLLGSSGNVGIKDFGEIYFKSIGCLLDFETGESKRDAKSLWTSSITQNSNVQDLKREAILLHYDSAGDVAGEVLIQKQYDYGKSGESHGKGLVLANPADVILAIEGLLTFSGSTVRAKETDVESRPEYSFAVPLVAGSADTSVQAEARSFMEEIWLPIWEKPKSWVGLQEDLGQLLRGELLKGRIGNSIDFAEKACRAARQRDIDKFIRYGFFPSRKGQQNAAVAIELVDTASTQDVGAVLREFLLQFTGLVRGLSTPEARLENYNRQLEKQVYGLASGHGSPLRLLILLGKIDVYLTQWSEGSTAYIPVLPRLNEAWILQILEKDSSYEAQLALSLASLYLRKYASKIITSKERKTFRIEAQTAWAPALEKALFNLQQRWHVLYSQGEMPYPVGYISPSFRAIAAFLSNTLNQQRILDLAQGFMLCDMPPQPRWNINEGVTYLPTGYRLFALRQWGIPQVAEGLPQNPALFSRPEFAYQQVRRWGLQHNLSPPVAGRITALEGAALAFPLAPKQLNTIVHSLGKSDEN